MTAWQHRMTASAVLWRRRGRAAAGGCGCRQRACGREGGGACAYQCRVYAGVSHGRVCMRVCVCACHVSFPPLPFPPPPAQGGRAADDGQAAVGAEGRRDGPGHRPALRARRVPSCHVPLPVNGWLGWLAGWLGGVVWPLLGDSRGQACCPQAPSAISSPCDSRAFSTPAQRWLHNRLTNQPTNRPPNQPPTATGWGTLRRRTGPWRPLWSAPPPPAASTRCACVCVPFDTPTCRAPCTRHAEEQP
jgi:hypothetical protein